MILVGRVYTEPEPDRGPHPGYRGELTITDEGIWLYPGVSQWLWADGGRMTWENVEVPTLAPWHRVHLVEQGDEHAVA